MRSVDRVGQWSSTSWRSSGQEPGLYPSRCKLRQRFLSEGACATGAGLGDRRGSPEGYWCTQARSHHSGQGTQGLVGMRMSPLGTPETWFGHLGHGDSRTAQADYCREE
jgi:hypothetical protein